MDVSVVVATYNRAESLRRMLTSCCEIHVPDGLEWELLIVDNNSTDHTRSVVDDFASRLPCRYVFEPTQGKSHALNRGVDDATGALLLFTDDDVHVDPSWIAGMVGVAERHPDAAYFAGRVVPTWDTEPPTWFAENARSWLSLITGNFDLGDREVVTLHANGGNMAIRASVFDADIRFHPDLGVNGTGRGMGGEDSDIIISLRAAGEIGWYSPTAGVEHYTIASRLTERYVRDWFIAEGASDAWLGHVPHQNLWFGAPRGHWKKLVVAAFKYGMTCPIGLSRVWLPAEIELATSWGVIQEMRRTTIGAPALWSSPWIVEVVGYGALAGMVNVT